MELALDPVLANPCLILANPLPISGQSKDQVPFNAETSIGIRVDWHSWSQSEANRWPVTYVTIEQVLYVGHY